MHSQVVYLRLESNLVSPVSGIHGHILTKLITITHVTVSRSWFRRPRSHSGPHAWNLLPENVQKSTSIVIFKSSLAFLF